MSAAFILCCLALAANPAETDYPFLAEVILDQAEVQSGNGRAYYTTDRLPMGTVVEVHRRDSGGWMAIRPPEGSFSWVPAAQVKHTETDDVVEVVSEEAVSWIGSRTDTVREHRYKVKLKVGERLEILGERQVPGEDGQSETWYKIAPPVGEFRWMYGRELARIESKLTAEPHEEVVQQAVSFKDATEAALATAESTPKADVTPAATFRPRTKLALTSLHEPYPESQRFASRTPPSFSEPIQPRETYRDTARAETFVRPVGYENVIGKEPAVQAVNMADIVGEKPPVSSDGFVPRGSRPVVGKPVTDREPLLFVPSTFKGSTAGDSSPANVVGAGVAPVSQPLAPVTPITPAVTESYLSRTDLDARLTALEAELTVMLAGDPKTWQLPRIRAEAEKLIEQTPTAADRGRIRLMVEKIHSFATTFNVEDDPRFASLPAEAKKPNEPEVPQALDPKYDGVGWLKPVISRERPAAPYALVDSDGRPLAFVTPAPGMNLNRYLNKPLGVYGRRGVVESLNTPHIVVERVIDLGRHLR